MEKEDYKQLFGPDKSKRTQSITSITWDEFKKEYYELDNQQRKFLEELDRKIEKYTLKLSKAGSNASPSEQTLLKKLEKRIKEIVKNFEEISSAVVQS